MKDKELLEIKIKQLAALQDSKKGILELETKIREEIKQNLNIGDVLTIEGKVIEYKKPTSTRSVNYNLLATKFPQAFQETVQSKEKDATLYIKDAKNVKFIPLDIAVKG